MKALLNSLFFGAVGGQLGVSNMEQCRFCISKATYPFSLTHLVVKQRIQEVIHTYTIYRRPFRLLKEITHPAQERLPTPPGFTSNTLSSVKLVWIHLGHTSTTAAVGPTRPTVFLPYPRRLQSLTIFRCHFEGS